MNLARLELSGFKSFAKKIVFNFNSPVVAIVGPNGSGKSNIAEAIRFVLGEQSMKSMRGKRGEDLIWNGSAASPRANRGSVSLVFNNQSRFLNIDFDEAIIERIVHRDGVNEYRMNGSQVRLKDIFEVLATANIGQSGHHIISQGEADKILSASPRERREILEDALGLKVYQYKLEESARKLEKTEENVRHVQALRKEIAPHLRFLKKQVEKVEKAEELKKSAVTRFRAYFKREDEYITKTKKELSERLSQKKTELESITKEVALAKNSLQDAAEDTQAHTILELSKSLDDARALRALAAKKAARLEGQIEVLEKTASKVHVGASHIALVIDESERNMNRAAEAGVGALLDFVKELFGKLRAIVRSAENAAGDVGALKDERAGLLITEKEEEKKEINLTAALEKIRAELDLLRIEEREKERSLFELAAREREVRHTATITETELERLTLLEDEFKRERAEAGALFGRTILSYADDAPLEPLPRLEQEREKHELEKTKIRLEEMGAAGGDEVMKEYKEVSEREGFLERELADLERAAASLKGLIEDLNNELRGKFNNGLDAINIEFTKLFALMFNGGSASLTRVKEQAQRTAAPSEGDDDEIFSGQPEAPSSEELTEGIDIALSIPRKRVKSLVMLSGGERALTSIALIFAMSSVNPPPFLVLDETDAALDESNSRRYGDMIAALAAKSQLILITHNRETMSRASILYGVTMGGDGVSKVLSVQLEEAIKVAK